MKDPVPPPDRVTVVEVGDIVMGEVAGEMSTVIATGPANPTKLARSMSVAPDEPGVIVREVLTGVIEKYCPVTFSDTRMSWTSVHGLAASMNTL